MPTKYEYAQLARHVYDLTNQVPVGWNVLKRHPQDEKGLQAAAYKKEDEVVVSIRGTIPGWKNWYYDNLRLAFGIMPASVDPLVSFLGDVKSVAPAGSRFTITGHSLGAALATIIGWKDRDVQEVAAFDSPATSSYTPRSFLGNQNLRVNTYLTTPNGVSIVGNKHTAFNMGDNGVVSRVLINHGEGDNWYKAFCVYSSIYRLSLPVGAALAWTGFISPVTFGIGALAATLIGNPSWVSKQHEMIDIERALAPDSGVELRKMDSWQSGLLKGGAQSWVEAILRGALPFHPANPGLHTITNNHKVVEERIRRIPEYLETGTRPLRWVDRVLSYDTRRALAEEKLR